MVATALAAFGTDPQGALAAAGLGDVGERHPDLREFRGRRGVARRHLEIQLGRAMRVDTVGGLRRELRPAVRIRCLAGRVKIESEPEPKRQLIARCGPADQKIERGSHHP